MDKNRRDKIIKSFEKFKETTDYTQRVRQSRIVPIFKDIIHETIQSGPITNEKLTGLIQLFKWKCSKANWNKYININITDEEKREILTRQFNELGEQGYTGAGKAAVTGLSIDQLEKVHGLLSNAFKITTVDSAVELVRNYQKENIPIVTVGIFSPWLHYINPNIFPVFNNKHKSFARWLMNSERYEDIIIAYNELLPLLGETDHGLLDAFIYSYVINDDDVISSSRIEQLLSIIHAKTGNIWRCATSGYWDFIFHNEKLTVNWLDHDTDYTLDENITASGGKLSISRWVKDIQVGDLLIVMDLYKYYGVAIIESLYTFKSQDQEVTEGVIKPCINVRFLHKLNDPVNHNLNVTHNNPATFFQLEGMSFNEKDTFSFIVRDYPEAFKTIEEHFMQNTNKKSEKPLNIILYGPPGTGKTYHSINYAVAIVENKPVNEICQEKRSTVKKRFEKYIEEGQIAFCTFHQSLGYEDFIEGIKPVEPASEEEQLSYAVEDGIFKKLCINASFSLVQQDITKETEKALDFSGAYDGFVDAISEQILKGEEVKIPTISGGLVMVDSITRNNNIKIKHVNGTREYIVSKNRLGKLAQAFPDLKEVTNVYDQFRSEIGGSNSSAYWAVLNAVRKQSIQNVNSEIRSKSEKEYAYDVKKGIIDTLKNDDFKKENPKQYVLIIDEINRGNVSQVFGEIITLMEDDKRLGAAEALKAILPYSKENFGVPCNLHIIGTMNTADRSVEALDTALRRRFAFVNLQPEPDKLTTTDDGINLTELLSVLNNRLSILKDVDHTIGHAWLWNVRNIDQLKEVFQLKILPLLKEFFYNDYEKLGLVLGDTFFEPHMQVNSNVFAEFTGGNGLAMQYDQSWQFRLKPIEKITITDFRTLTPLSNRSLPDEEQ